MTLNSTDIVELCHIIWNKWTNKHTRA